MYFPSVLESVRGVAQRMGGEKRKGKKDQVCLASSCAAPQLENGVGGRKRGRERGERERKKDDVELIVYRAIIRIGPARGGEEGIACTRARGGEGGKKKSLRCLHYVLAALTAKRKGEERGGRKESSFLSHSNRDRRG